jgi:hypothetical protein
LDLDFSEKLNYLFPEDWNSGEKQDMEMALEVIL